MATTQEYLSQLQSDKQTLVNNLVTKGVSATSDETFTSLVPKVLDIESGSDAEITDGGYLFYQNRRLDYLYEILALCKNVTKTNYMFASCDELTTLDLSQFNNSDNTTMQNMFQGCTNLTTINLLNFDTSNVTNMGGVFGSCNRLTTINLASFNTNKVEQMNSMFQICNGLTELDVSRLNTSNVTNMYQMFYGCFGLTELDVSNFDTSKVANMGYMFYNCGGLTELDLSNFDTSSTSVNQNMFQYCRNLTKLIINRQDVFKMTNTNMFQDTPIASGTGYVYVPDNMVETYKSATNWSTYADQIKGMSELPTEET